VIGAGISGAAVAYELAQHGKVAIVESESLAGYHSTGRSAALYTPNYGPELVRKICRIAYPFLSQPPKQFTDQPLLSARGFMSIFNDDYKDLIADELAQGGDQFVRLDKQQTLKQAPFLRSERIHGAIYEEGVKDLNVDALYQGFLRGFKKRGGEILLNFRVNAMHRHSSYWELSSDKREINARLIVNAAGAWADEIGRMANATNIGLQPKRRTAMLVDLPDNVGSRLIPAMLFYGSENYIKPELGKLMVSPGDETPVIPQDIQPDDLDIATLVDWLERETTIDIQRIEHRWAGLRNFVPDGNPVVGYDSKVDDFFWLAGQGGYGIMMSQPLASASVSILNSNCLPLAFTSMGIDVAQLSVPPR